MDRTDEGTKKIKKKTKNIKTDEMDIIPLKNIIYEIKNSLNRFNSRLDMAEARTGILEDSSIENTKAC